jgi:hypothetical protein
MMDAANAFIINYMEIGTDVTSSITPERYACIHASLSNPRKAGSNPMHEQFTRFVLLQSVGGQKKQWESPNTRSMKFNVQFTKDRETKNLQKSALASKVVNPFTRAHAPPFIGRRMDFYIPTIPSNLGNIPNVNMHTNVFYIP